MSLGCDRLSDEQLFELTQEICGEWVKRDPLVRKAAQCEIYSAAEKLAEWKRALADAILRAKADYCDLIGKECREAVEQGVGSGEIKLFTPAQEATLIANATIKARERLAEQVVQDAQRYLNERVPDYVRLELVSVVIARLARQSMSPARQSMAREIWQRAEEQRRQASVPPYPVQPDYDSLLTMSPAQYMEWRREQARAASAPPGWHRK